MITKDELKQLSLLYDKWAGSVEVGKSNFWNRDPIAVKIKKTMHLSGKWRNKARGNPHKAYLAAIETKKRKAAEEAARLAKAKAEDDWWTAPLPPIKIK